MRLSPINSGVLPRTTVKTQINQHKNIAFTSNIPCGKKSFTEWVLIGTMILTPIAGTRYIEERNKTLQEFPQIKPLYENFTSDEEIINYSRDRIVEHLNDTTPREYGIIYDNDKMKILVETLGNKQHVKQIIPQKFIYNLPFMQPRKLTGLHGHPQGPSGYTTTFSFGDFKSFVENNEMVTCYVYNRYGQYCRMEKTENFKEPTSKDLARIEEDFYRNFFIFQPVQKTFIDKNNKPFKLVDSPGMHRYLKRLCEAYGIKYKTTFGTYGDNQDAYADGYYISKN